MLSYWLNFKALIVFLMIEEYMSHVKIEESSFQAIKQFQAPHDLGFGKVISPVMITADFENGQWGPLTMSAYEKLNMDPTCKVLHYAQEIFEGLKAYISPNETPVLFRPEMNAKRFNYSATMMAMPELPVEAFIEAIHTITWINRNFIPKISGSSLYIRPFMFSTEESLGIKPSEKFRFMVIASPSASYFSSDSLPVYIERKAIRACPGGVGTAKTGGNYAAGLKSSVKAQQHGCLQTLWLDAFEHKYIEEMSGMNFMCVIDDILHTPKLTDTILSGITRDSILNIAKELNVKTQESTLEIEQILEYCKSGKCPEAFACGTAVIITPISKFVEENNSEIPLKYPEGNISMKLREKLLNIQEARDPGPAGWSVPVKNIL